MIKYIISFVVVFTTHGTERTWYVVHCFFSYTRITPNVSTINTAAPDFLFGRVNLQINGQKPKKKGTPIEFGPLIS